MQVRDVVAVRRAADLLRSMPNVDRGRIGFVGWSAGARTGAIVSGVEPHIRVFVLMSGGALPVGDYAAQAPARLRPELVRVLRQIDPLRFIARARAGTILLQDGRQDQIVPRRALDALAAAAPRGTIVRWYPAGHALNARAYRDQLAWLARKLTIKGPPIPGAKEGP
jgi:dienelactone hydrolase